jgi:hypothetical protein
MSALTMGKVTAAPPVRDSSPMSVPQAKPAIRPNVYVGTLGVFLGAGLLNSKRSDD